MSLENNKKNNSHKQKKDVIINADAIDSDTGKTISSSNLEDIKNQEKEFEKKRKQFIARAKIIRWLLPVIIIIVIGIAIISFFFWVAAAIILGVVAFILGILVLIFKIIYQKVTSIGKK